VEELRLNANQLTGTLFPEAWLLPGALPRLQTLDVKNNRFTGTLPPSLAWPSIRSL